MRSVFTTCLFGFFCFAFVAAAGKYWSNAHALSRSAKVIRHWAHNQPLPDYQRYQEAVTNALHRAIIYDSLLQSDHLLNGMVVGRTFGGRYIHECDSLLFSSLRVVALKKLGFHNEATRAWSAIEKSQVDGHWRRHPQCWDKSTSRDMIIGVVAALTQSPANAREHITALYSQIERTGGYVSDGPVYVSYLTPSVARLLRRIGRAHGFRYVDMPDIVRRGYSTNEWAVPLLRNGYRTHLAALATWVDMELADRYGLPLSQMDRMNIDWITYKLVDEDPENMFFRYLRLRSTHSLTPAVRWQLLSELTSLPTFPPDQLPADCDRKADYLWQRDSREYKPRSQFCYQQFAGVDFLWMASLLMTDHPLLTH